METRRTWYELPQLRYVRMCIYICVCASRVCVCVYIYFVSDCLRVYTHTQNVDRGRRPPVWSGSRHPHPPSIVRSDKSFRNRANIIVISLSLSLSLPFFLFYGVYPKIFRNSVLRYMNIGTNIAGRDFIVANIIKFLIFLPLFVSLPFILFLVSQTGKKRRKRFSDSRKWFKRLCWLTRRSWTKFHQESHSSPSFPSARSLCEEKGFLQLVKWKNSCISFSLLRVRVLSPFFSSHILTLNRASSPPFGTATTFFLDFFLYFFPFSCFFFFA